MPLDPQIQLLVDNLPNGIALPVGDPAQAREVFRNITVAMRDAQPPAQLKPNEDISVPGATGDLPARIYRPLGDGPTATIVYFHGGGFVVGDIESYDLTARTIAERTGATVLSAHYRLAPEDPFPAGVEDVLSIARWALANISALGGDTARVIVGGDSAGGNYAAVVAQELAGEQPGFSGQMLLYPVADFAGEYASQTEHADGPVLTAEAAVMFHGAYLRDDSDPADPRISPLRADDLSNLPPTVIATAEYDVLHGGGVAYAEKMAAQGVAVTHLDYATLPHGFFGFGPVSAGADAAISEVCAAVAGLVAQAALA